MIAMAGALDAPRATSGRTEHVTGRFDPIALDALVATAELMTRLDRKYLVPEPDVLELLSGLNPRTRVLEIDGVRGFAYDSVYFDTEDHLSYRLTAQKRRRRFKLRTRTYLDTGTAFLELKTKNGRGRTVKDRIPYRSHDRARLTLEGRAYIAGLLRGHAHDPALVERLQPALVSRYRRTTLLLPCGSRATVDTDLRWGSADQQRGLGLAGHVIIETKSAGGLSELDHALWRAGHRPTGISKFGAGTAALYPSLPRNKWGRALRVFPAPSHASDDWNFS